MAGKAKASISAPEGLRFGDSFWFTATPKTDGSWLRFTAWQQGVLVYSEVRGTEPGQFGTGVPFSCGPSMRWTGGPANCVGEVGHPDSKGAFIVDARIDFSVGVEA